MPAEKRTRWWRFWERGQQARSTRSKEISLQVEPLEDRLALKALAFLVNGLGGCCTPPDVENYLRSNGVEIHIANWNSIDRSGPTGGTPAELSDSDEDFVNDMATRLGGLDDNDTIILIGHGQGGEALLKAAARTTREIDLLAVLDPVAADGSRSSREVPADIRYFYNRWQTALAPPVNFETDGAMAGSGYRSLLVDYGIADQALHNASHAGYPFSGALQQDLQGAIRGLLFDNRIASVAHGGQRLVYLMRDGSLYYRDPGSAPVLLDLGVESYAVGTSGAVSGQNRNGDVWHYDTTRGHVVLDHDVHSYRVSPDGALVVGLNRNGTLWRYSTDSGAGYRIVNDSVQAFALAADRTLYVLEASGTLWRYLPGSETREKHAPFATDGPVVSFALAADGTLYELQNSGKLWRYRDANWFLVDSGVRSFALVDADTIYELLTSGELDRYTVGAGRQNLDTAVQAFALGHDGALYALRANGDLVLENVQTGGGSLLFAAVKSFAVAADGTLVYLNNAGRLWQLGGATPLATGVASFTIPLDGTVHYVAASGESWVILSDEQPTFQWPAAVSAVRYDIWVDDLTSGQSPVLRNQNATGTSWTAPQPLTPGHVYQWWAGAIGPDGTTSWGPAAYVSLKPLDTPSATAPSGTLSTELPTFTWSAASGAAGYELWVDDLTSGQSPALHQTSATGTAWTPVEEQALTPGHRFRWWLRAVSRNGTGGTWSGPYEFTIAPPPVPSPLTPGETITSDAPTFTWSTVANASRYEIWVSDLASGQVFNIPDATGSTGTLTAALSPGHGYRWWVRAISGSGAGGVWSSPLDFSIAPLATPTALAPGSSSTSDVPTFAWSSVAGAAFYDIWVSDLLTGAVVRNAAATGTSWTPNSFLSPGHAYRWWVRALSSNGTGSAWSGPLDFAVAPLAVPGGLAVSFAGSIPTLHWNAMPLATHFDIWVDDLTTGQSPSGRNPNATGTSWTVPELTSGHRYRWWIRALSGDSTAGIWSAGFDFEIAVGG